MIKSFFFILFLFTLINCNTHALFNKSKKQDYEDSVLKAYNKKYFSQKRRQKAIAERHIEFYNYTQDERNYCKNPEIGFEYLHKLGMNGNHIEIAVIENDFIEAENIKFTQNTIIQSPILNQTYTIQKNLIEQLIDLSEEEEKKAYQERLKTLNKKYYGSGAGHSLHIIGILNKIAPGITIYPIHSLDFNNPDVLSTKLNAFSGSVITHSTSIGLSDEAQIILKPILENHAYFYAASNEGCFLSEPQLRYINELPDLHVAMQDIILVGNYDQEKKIIHESSNLPGKDHAHHFIFTEGTNIKSLSINENCELIEEQKTGTSFAAPYAAAVCALFAKYYPDLSIKDIQQTLLESAEKFSKNHDSSLFGQGLINIKKTTHNLQKKANPLFNEDEIIQFAQEYFPTISDQSIHKVIRRYNKKKTKKPIKKRIYLINKFADVLLTNN